MNLGEKLKGINARSVAEANRERVERDAAASLKARQELELVHLFFSQARERITHDIGIGEPPKPVYLGKRGSNGNYEAGRLLASWGTDAVVTSPKHSYHFAWQEFETWARDNGLIAKLEYEHDGVGIESWHALVVEPA
jgi:hypothetical protein